jgi:hypothetical protein
MATIIISPDLHGGLKKTATFSDWTTVCSGGAINVSAVPGAQARIGASAVGQWTGGGSPTYYLVFEVHSVLSRFPWENEVHPWLVIDSHQMWAYVSEDLSTSMNISARQVFMGDEITPADWVRGYARDTTPPSGGLLDYQLIASKGLGLNNGAGQWTSMNTAPGFIYPASGPLHTYFTWDDFTTPGSAGPTVDAAPYTKGMSTAALYVNHTNKYSAGFLTSVGMTPQQSTTGRIPPRKSAFGMSPTVRWRVSREEPPAEFSAVQIYDANMAFVGPVSAKVAWTENFDAPHTLDTLEILPKYHGVDGVGVDRIWMIKEGWYAEFAGVRFRITQKEGDKFGGITCMGISAEQHELSQLLTNEIPFAAKYTSLTPQELFDKALTGAPEGMWLNGDFASYEQLAGGFSFEGWTQSGSDGAWRPYSIGGPAVEARSFAAQLDGYQQAAIMTSNPCGMVSGAKLKLKLDYFLSSGFNGDIYLDLEWVSQTGSVLSRHSLPLSTSAVGLWTTGVIAPSNDWVVARGSLVRLRIRVVNNASSQIVRFRNIRVIHETPSSGWTLVSDCETRPDFLTGAAMMWDAYDAWTLTNNDIRSSTQNAQVMKAFTGDFITVNFAAGGTAARAAIYVDGQYRATISVSSNNSYSVYQLDRHLEHLIQIRVESGTVIINSVEISSENRVSIRAYYRKLYDLLQDVKSLVDGELYFDSTGRVIYLSPPRAENVTDQSIVEFRRGSNLLEYETSEETDDIANDIILVGYGDPPTQLVTRMQDTSERGGSTSEAEYGRITEVAFEPDVADTETAFRRMKRILEDRAWGRKPGRAVVPWKDTSLLRPGDMVRVTWDEEETLRVISIRRETGTSEAVIQFGAHPRTYDPVLYTLELNQKMEQLLRS